MAIGRSRKSRLGGGDGCDRAVAARVAARCVAAHAAAPVVADHAVAGHVVAGTAAVDADDWLIYNSSTGALAYDADGAGAGAAVQFAMLSGGLVLQDNDFLIL